MTRSNFGYIRKTILKTGKPSYNASFIHPETKKRISKTFRSKTQAQRWLKEINNDILTGNFKHQQPTEEQTTANTITVNDYAKTWMEALERRGISPNTKRSYLSNLRRYITPTPLGNKLISKLTKQDCVAWYADLPANKPGSRQNAYRTLLSLLRSAVENGIIETVPLAIKGAMAKKVSRDENRERVATPEQVREIAALMPPAMAIAVLIAGFMGLRYSEIAALRRKHVDFDSRQLKIRSGVKRTELGTLVEGPPKTARSVRNVPISDEMAKALKAHLNAHVKPGADSLLIYSRTDQNKFLSNNSLHLYYNRAVDAAGLPKFGFHQLRATCATLLMRVGATPAEIQAILGHSDWATSQLYQRAPKERLSEVMDRINQ